MVYTYSIAIQVYHIVLYRDKTGPPQVLCTYTYTIYAHAHHICIHVSCIIYKRQTLYFSFIKNQNLKKRGVGGGEYKTATGRHEGRERKRFEGIEVVEGWVKEEGLDRRGVGLKRKRARE